MISYAQTLARSARSGWNEAERISKAVITWMDSTWEYEVEVENEGMTDCEFRAWVEEQAEGFAKEAAEAEHAAFEAVDRISYEYEAIDVVAAFRAGYEAYGELEWECRAGR